MIILDGVTKVAGAGKKARDVLNVAHARLPSDHRIAVLGPIAEDKNIFIKLLAGVILPNAGRIIRKSRISFPVGHLGGFAGDLSVRLNVAHVARLYGADVDEVVNFVSQIAGWAAEFNRPYSALSNTKRRCLSDILAFSIPFDVYVLSDDVVLPTGTRYNTQARALFEARARDAGVIVATDDVEFAREFCDMGLVLDRGEVHLFNDVERAIAFVEEVAFLREAEIAELRQQKALRRAGTTAALSAQGSKPKTSKEERAARKQRRLARKEREQ